jgi:hypothetical protein
MTEEDIAIVESVLNKVFGHVYVQENGDGLDIHKFIYLETKEVDRQIKTLKGHRTIKTQAYLVTICPEGFESDPEVFYTLPEAVKEIVKDIALYTVECEFDRLVDVV